MLDIDVEGFEFESANVEGWETESDVEGVEKLVVSKPDVDIAMEGMGSTSEVQWLGSAAYSLSESRVTGELDVGPSITVSISRSDGLELLCVF